MLKLLVNFFGGAAAFVVVVVEAGAVLLLPALLVEGVRATASRLDDDVDAALSVSMEGVVADSDDTAGATVASSSCCFAAEVSVLEVSVVASSVEAATEVWTDGRVSLPLPEEGTAAS